MEERERERERESLSHSANTSPPPQWGSRGSGRDNVEEDELNPVEEAVVLFLLPFLFFVPHLVPRWAGPFELHSSISFQRDESCLCFLLRE